MGALDTTTAGFDAALKDIYQGPIRYQLNKETRLLDLFTKGDISQYEWEGRQMVLSLQKARNVGIKATAEGGLLPASSHQSYAKLLIPMAYIEGRIELTAQVMKASRSDKGSFARAMETEQKGLVNDIARQRNRMLAGFGSGTLATISAGATSATQTLANPGGVAGTVNVTRFIKANMVLAFTSTTGTLDTNGLRTVVSVSEPTIVLDSSVTTSTGDLVSLGATDGTTNQSSFGLEPMGVLGIVDSTTYVSSVFGLDRSQAANSFFRSNILSNVGALSPDLLQRGIDNAEEISGQVINQFIAHASVRREVLKLTDADRRYTQNLLLKPDAGTAAGGFKADLTFNGIPIKIDKDFAYGTLMGVVTDHLFWVPETEGEWADEDGNILFRVQNKDNFEARYRLFENFFSDQGNVHLRLDGITATVSSGVFSD